MPYIFAIAAGVFTTLEVNVNAELSKLVSPKIATFYCLIIGAIFVFIATIYKGSMQQYKSILYVNPLLLVGGIFGALIIYFSIKATPSIGVTATLILVVASQVLSGLFIESFITNETSFGLLKIMGLIFLLIGIYILVD